MVETKQRTLTGAALILFLDNLNYAIAYTFFPLILLKQESGFLEYELTQGARHLLLSLLLVVTPLAQIAGIPFFGDISDQIGRKKTLIVTLTGTFFGNLLTAIAVMSKWYTFVLFSRIVTGVFSASLAICMATMLDFCEGSEYKKKKLMGTAAALLGIGWTLAILSGPFFSLNFDWRVHTTLPFWIVSVIPLFSLIILYSFFYETELIKNKQTTLFQSFYRILNVLETRQFHYLYLVLFLWFLGYFLTINWMSPISILKFGESSYGIFQLMIFFCIAWTLSALFVNRILASNYSNWHLTVWSLLFLSIVYFFSGVSVYFLYFATAFIFSAAIAAVIWSNHLSLISLDQQQGKSIGLAFATIALAQTIGPILGGLIAGLSIDLIYYTAAFLVFAAYLILTTYMVQNRKMHG